jgi:hypothetical protein
VKTKARAGLRELWRCPVCGRRFANHNQSHACGRHDLAHHFAGKPPAIRQLYRRLVDLLRQCGPVIILPEKTRIAFQVRMCLRDYLAAEPRALLPGGTEADLDAEFLELVREAYAVGQQRHL